MDLSAFIFRIVFPCLIATSYGEKQVTHLRRKRETCTALFTAIDAGHTMCLTDNANAVAVTVTDTVKQDLLNKHNFYRGDTSDATNMQYAVWDNDVAEVAAKWARQCSLSHESTEVLRRVPKLPGIPIGQNIAFGQATFLDALAAWYDEIEFFQYGTGSLNGEEVRHYTQISIDSLARIGCGQALCEISGHTANYYVCNYVRSQRNTEVSKPWCKVSDLTTTCMTGCLKRSTEGLCDCGGKVCLNSGTLQLATCTCECISGFSGPSCETFECPASDQSFCGNTGNCRFDNYKSACPYLCGSCPLTCTKVCQNGGNLNSLPCLCNCPTGYSGELCQVTPGGCTKVCQNGGVLNSATCSCSCPSGYGGDLCETCTKSCRNGGGLNTLICQCACPSGFGGDLCETCTKTCQNGGGLNAGTCQCSCPAGFGGDFCQTCNKICQNNGALNAATCQCSCPLGTGGDQCQDLDGNWGQWGAWNSASTSCSVTCGTTATKVVYRYRSCNNPIPVNNGRTCPGSDRGERNENCQLQPCQQACTKLCQNGGVLNALSCTCGCQTGYWGDVCENRNGNWGAWGSWNSASGICTATCGTTTTKVVYRYRQCDSPFPLNAGQNCPGVNTDARNENCGFSQCPPVCTKACQNGGALNTFTCTCVCPAGHGGDFCQDRDGQWGAWGAWNSASTICSASCGTTATKTVYRYRNCDNPFTLFNGRYCQGDSRQSREDNCGLTNECPAQAMTRTEPPLWFYVMALVLLHHSQQDDSAPYTVYYVVDGSQSVQANNFLLIKDALKRIVSETFTRNNDSRVGVVLYGSVVTDVVLASSNISSIFEQIDDVDLPGGGSATDAGIQKALTLLLEDPSPNSQAMVVITDGVSTYPQDTRAAALSSRSAGVFMLAVGIDVYVKWFSPIYRRYRTELQGMASSNESVIQMADFDQLSGHSSDIVSALHRSAVTKEIVTIVSPPGDFTVLVGNSGIFQTTLSRADAPSVMWWTRGLDLSGNTRYVQSLSGADYRLTIPNVQHTDAGVYSVVVDGDVRQATLTVVSPLNSVTAVEGTDAVLQTRVSPVGAPSGVWSRNSVPLTAGSKYSFIQAGDIRQLLIRNVVGADQGGYTYTVKGLPTNGFLTVSGAVVNGGFSEWAAWNPAVFDCPVTCGREATKPINRTRVCNSPPPANGGQDCQGVRVESKTVNCLLPNDCPVDGAWTNWGAWEELCLTSCGVSVRGIRSRSRSCTNPSPRNNGQLCYGENFQTKQVICNVPRCPVNGGVSPWGQWILSSCSATCGRSITRRRTKLRSCDSPPPQNNGTDCSVPLQEVEELLCSVPLCAGLQFVNDLTNQTIQTGYLGTFQLNLTEAGITRGTWYKDNVLLTNSDKIQITTRDTVQTLVIVNGQLADSGLYSYKLDGMTTQAYLTVLPIDCPADVVVLLDGSQFVITATDFEGIKEILKQQINNALQQLGVLRFGMVVYGNNVSAIIQLSANFASLRMQIDSISQPGGATYLNLGLDEARNLLTADRLTTPKHILAILGSTTSSPTETESAGTAARQAGINVKALGIIGFYKTVSFLYSRFKADLAAVATDAARVVEYDDMTAFRNGFNLMDGICNINVDGGWSSWMAWTHDACPSCGFNVMADARRTRACTSPTPQNGGLPCVGSAEETSSRVCQVPRCPIDGGFSEWVQWSSPVCTESCGLDVTGVTTRNRTCTNPSPQFGGRVCDGAYQEFSRGRCNVPRCPVNGGYGPWGAWSPADCSATCGTNVTRMLRRTRNCDTPVPQFNGADCSGVNQEDRTELCNVPACGDDFQQLQNNVTTTVGSTVTLEVTFSQSQQQGAWYKQNVPVPDTDRTKYSVSGLRHRLTITGATTADEGMYIYVHGRGNTFGYLKVLAGVVHGGFSPWSAWDVPSCTQTCGASAQKVFTRTRSCTNPAPANGGSGCNGSSTETRTENCLLGPCTTTGLCDSAQRRDDVGYRYHPTDCDKYIQCYYNPNGSVIAVYRRCPFDYYWNQETFRCAESWKVNCPIEKCTGPCVASYKMEGSCRSYWTCDGGKSEARCCPYGFSFLPGHGCRPSYHCDDICPTPYISREVCNKRPDNVDVSRSYHLNAGSFGWQTASCATGTYFDILDCGCNDQSSETCSPSHALDFISSTTRSWLTATNVAINAGIANVDTNSRIYLDVKMTINKPVSVRFRFKETAAPSNSRALLSSSNCKKGNSLLITADDDGVHFNIWSWYGEVTKMTIFTQGIARTEWKTVSVLYDGRELTGVLTSGSNVYISKIYASDCNILECGLNFGTDESSTATASRFIGSLDSLQVFSCNPGFF